MEESAREPLHVLILTDRDWTHPQGGGTGTNLFGQVSRWIAWGHRVTVVSCSYKGAAKTEQIGPLTIHRVGGRSTVFPRVIFRGLTGRLPKADVVLEVINGITFLSPLWLRSPRLALVHHVHRDHYVAEMGLLGRIAAWFLETAPLRLIYRGTRFLTISEASKADLERTGVDGERIDVGYIGVELGALEPAPEKRAAEPTLLFLGRLKRYKRIELVLDALEAVPEATLDMAGEGDHGEALWEEIKRRGLQSRVRMLGHVDEEKKAELLQSTWGNLTASSAEGWCLTVMEAAACGTPSVALRVGGLPESIAHERTGLLAHDVEELQECAQRLVREPGLRERLGQQARERAVEFSWDGTARRTMSLLEREHDRVTEQPSLIKRFTSSDTGRAAALGGSMLANNFIALIFTVVFARLLGASGYGSLGALVAAFAVLLVPGSALQTTAAREVSTAVAEGLDKPGVEVRRWLERIMLLLGVTLALGIFLREPMASLVGVEDEWAAGAILPTGALWLAICIQRGALQGLGRYVVVGSSIVAEAGLRLALGLVLYGIGLGVTGAFLGQAAALVVLFLALLVPLLPTLRTPATGLVGRATRLRDLFGRAWVPILGFTLIAALQNIDIVWVKREIGGDEAGSYAAASVAAKAVIWIAIGLGLYLLPEAVKRTRTGGDARPVLGKSLGLIALVAVPMIVLYAFFGKQVMGAVFGDDLTAASNVLPFLALAMALLACAYLAVQYLIALERANFLPVLGLAAAAELILLPVVGAAPTNVALVVVALQLAMLPAFFALVTRSVLRRPSAAPA